MKRTTPSSGNGSGNSKYAQTIALELFRSSSFLMLNKSLLRQVGPQRTIFLENLVDKYGYFAGRNMVREDGSFFLTHEDQCEQTGMGEHQIRECKRYFKNLGILTTVRKGAPAKEYYLIDFAKLMKIFMDGVGQYLRKSEVHSSENLTTFKETKEKDNKENKYISPRQKNDDNDLFTPLAIKLADTITQSKNIKITPSKIRAWANEIKRLHKSDGVSPQRIKDALDWYQDHIGELYIPVIESGGSLRVKFTKLEDAMKRAGAFSFPIDPKILTASPKKIIHRYFNDKNLTNAFYRDCYFPAEGLFPGVDKDKLARTLTSLHSQIAQEQTQNLSPHMQGLLPGPISLVTGYLTWIGDNDWITNLSIDMLNIRHSLFSRFRRDEASKDNLERDPLTGKSHLKG